MISIRGIFQDGKITMICPSSQTIPENSEVLVTFIEDSEADISGFTEDEQEELIEIEDDFEDDYEEEDDEEEDDEEEWEEEIRDPIIVRPQKLTPSGRVSRNAPCPCGSGKKYKNCCGKYRAP